MGCGQSDTGPSGEVPIQTRRCRSDAAQIGGQALREIARECARSVVQRVQSEGRMPDIEIDIAAECETFTRKNVSAAEESRIQRRTRREHIAIRIPVAAMGEIKLEAARDTDTIHTKRRRVLGRSR